MSSSPLSLHGITMVDCATAHVGCHDGICCVADASDTSSTSTSESEAARILEVKG